MAHSLEQIIPMEMDTDKDHMKVQILTETGWVEKTIPNHLLWTAQEARQHVADKMQETEDVYFNKMAELALVLNTINTLDTEPPF